MGRAARRGGRRIGGSSKLDVFGLGQCCLDLLALTREYPPPDVKCEVFDLTRQGGGPIATALVALARWGFRCAIAGVVGADPIGDEIRLSLDSEDVDVDGILTRHGGESQFAFIVAEPGSGRRTIFWRRPTGEPPSPAELDLDRIRSARVVHTDGLFPEASLAAAREARAAGVEVSVDAGTLRDGMVELARLSDHFLASSTFVEAYAPGRSPLDACRRLSKLGPSVVGVTVGARGWAAIADGVELEGPAYPVEAVDTTGCGDVFHAGYLYGLLRGWPPVRRLDFGAWAASRVAIALGGRSGIPSAGDWPGLAGVESTEAGN
jgi:ribokinase